MYLQYGSYQHAANEASVAISKQALFSDGGIARGVRERWSIQGRLQAADPTALSAAIAALQAAYTVQGLDVGFYFDGGAPTSHVIISAATNGGVRVVTPPSFPEGRGAEYSTFRTYTIVLEAEHLQADTTLLSWNEVLSFHGGGPRFGYLEPIVCLPQKQVWKLATTYRATQAGEAVGYLGYPLAPAPLWPGAEHVDRRDLRIDAPRRAGPLGSAVFTHFRISWTYHFEDAMPLVGLPTAPPG